MEGNCSNCGAELPANAKFCVNCGASTGQQSFENQATLQKSRKKVFIGISAVVITVVIIAVVLLIILSGNGVLNGADSRFVGQWDQTVGTGTALQWKFNGDGTLQTGYGGIMANVGTWKVNGSELCLYSGAVCYGYEFSDGGNTLTLNIFGNSTAYPFNIVLTKHV
jgi:hypothetical protein